ncbi:hypothetical protein NECAME_10810 [Necator americanus]|uniref:Uncharacterized protein n=1 Tax=Necator americanus TaxID=51031 RepID=W2T6Z4_NECAM|nr:hypothetical protein NECAME_10810 [Necator americanus]ETN77770.1 hypothetical protein NECAME_10810 [Necator americanus]
MMVLRLRFVDFPGFSPLCVKKNLLEGGDDPILLYIILWCNKDIHQAKPFIDDYVANFIMALFINRLISVSRMKSDLIFLACKIGSSMTASDASVPLLVKPIGRLQTSLSSMGSLRECAVLPNGKSGNDIRQTRAFCVNPGTSEIGRSSIESTCISGEVQICRFVIGLLRAIHVEDAPCCLRHSPAVMSLMRDLCTELFTLLHYRYYSFMNE